MEEFKGKRFSEACDGVAGRDAAFSTTHWSVVLSAGGANSLSSNQALEVLCRTYWYPLYAFVRRRGCSPPEAEDLTQGFFCHLFETEALRSVDRDKGKFRSFLLVTLTNFLNNEYRKSQAQKRGGQSPLESWDQLRAEERYRHEPLDNVTPETLFERRWAFTLVEEALAHLRQEYQGGDRLGVFEELLPLLVEELEPGALSTAAGRLKMNEGAVKVALHRLRRRFGEYLRREVASTVASPEQVEDEIRHLFSVLPV